MLPTPRPSTGTRQSPMSWRRMSMQTSPIRAWVAGPGTPVQRDGCTSLFWIPLSGWSGGIGFYGSGPVFRLTVLLFHLYTGMGNPSIASPSSRLRTIPPPGGKWMISRVMGIPLDWKTTARATASKYIMQTRHLLKYAKRNRLIAGIPDKLQEIRTCLIARHVEIKRVHACLDHVAVRRDYPSSSIDDSRHE